MARLLEPGEPTPLLRVARLSKTFPGLKALDDVAIEVQGGEIVAIVGHNGSGKSTLVKILAGIHEPDPEATIQVRSPTGELLSGAAARAEMHFIHQDLGLVDMLTTVENLSLSRPGRRRRSLAPVRGAAERHQAREAIARFGANFDVTVPVGELSAPERAIIAIARAMGGWTRADGVLVLDEPTTAFHSHEVEVLFDAVHRVAASGAGVVFISHRLDEVLGLADRVVVLRDGRVVADEAAHELDHDQMVELIVGRAVAAVDVSHDMTGTDPVLSVSGLSGETVSDLTLSVRSGEIVGVSGILGSGREELAALLCGAHHRRGGSIAIDGDELASDDSAAAIESGMACLPADRRRAGAVMDMNVRENLTLPMLWPLRRRLGRLDVRAERAETDYWIRMVALRPPDPERAMNVLSGGNQQKVVLAKWLRTRPRVLLLDEPTQGVDVGAKAAIYELILAAAQSGSAVLICSADAKELVSMCHRVLVLESGRVVSEIPREELSEARLVRDELTLHSGETANA